MQTTWLDWRAKWRRRKRLWNRLGSSLASIRMLFICKRCCVFDILIYGYITKLLFPNIYSSSVKLMFDQTVIH